jgi:hypothetical protein
MRLKGRWLLSVGRMGTVGASDAAALASKAGNFALLVKICPPLN